MNNEYEYIVNAFTKDGENTNLEVNNLNVTCITSKNDKFELDSDGNLTVNSINATEGITSFQDILDFIYPVGSIYLTTNLINPQVAFGGTWEQIKDKFLLACGDVYLNGSIGGEANHTLTINEMPGHNHTIGLSGGHHHSANFLEVRSRDYSQPSNNVARPNGSSYDSTGTVTTSDGSHTHISDYAGGNVAHNNMPPYLAVYVWKRVQ
ncbi:MAG TPA: hypothetical protein IAB56_06670 [Candidatus Scybalousia intestinigallinarum]|nr:hypothetical protein [Candidatus Scybalousia intestinigallinarum]